MNQEVIAALFNAFGELRTTKPVAVMHGYANEVYLLPQDDLVLRIPRNEWAAKRQKEEALILEELARVDLGFEVSHLRLYSENPAFMVTSYIEGDVYSRETIETWPTDQKVLFGQDLGTFLWNLHTRANVAAYQNIVFHKPELLEEFKRDIDLFPDKESALHKTATMHLALLEKFIKHEKSELVVTHSDIHAANIVFDKNKRLAGVLDFADVAIESLYIDMRRVFMLNEVVFDACVDTYEILSSKKIDRQLAKQWAIVHELSVLCRHYDEPNYPSIPRALEHIKTWLA